MVDGLGKMTIDSPLDKEGFHRQAYIKFQYHHRGVPSHNVSRYSEEPTSYTPYRLRPLASQTEETSKSLQDQSCLKHSEEQSCAEDMTQGNSGSKYFKLEPSGHSWFNLDQTSSKTRRQHQPGVKKCEQDILKIPSSWPFRTQPQLSESDVNDIKRTVRSRPCLTPLRGDIKSKINTSHPGHSFQVVSAPLSSITSDKDQIPPCMNKSKDKAIVFRDLTYPVVHMLDENKKQKSMPDHTHSDCLDSFLSTTQCIRPTNDSMINEQLQPPKYIHIARKDDKEQKKILGKSKRFGITRCNTFCQEGISLKRKESKSPFRPASTSSWRGKHMHMRFLDETYSEINQSDPDYFSNYLLSVSRPSLSSRPKGKPLRLATPNHTSCSIDASACAGVNDAGEPQHAQYSKDSSAKNDCENESDIKKNVGKSHIVQDNSHVNLSQTFLPTGRTLKTPGHPITNHTTVVHADTNGVNEKFSEKIESLPQSRYIQTETDSQKNNDKCEMSSERVHFENLCAGQSCQCLQKDDAKMAQKCEIGITDQISNVNQHRNTEHGGDYLALTNTDYVVYESDRNSGFRHCIDSHGLPNDRTVSQSVDMDDSPHHSTCCRKESVDIDGPPHAGTCCRKESVDIDGPPHAGTCCRKESVDIDGPPHAGTCCRKESVDIDGPPHAGTCCRKESVDIDGPPHAGTCCRKESVDIDGPPHAGTCCRKESVDIDGPPHAGTCCRKESVDMAGPPHAGTDCRKESVDIDGPPHPGTCCRKESMDMAGPPHSGTCCRRESADMDDPPHPATCSRKESMDMAGPPHSGTCCRKESVDIDSPPHAGTGCRKESVDMAGPPHSGTCCRKESVAMAGPPHSGTCCRKESVAMAGPPHPGTCCRKVGNNGDNELHQIDTHSDKRRFEQTSCVTGKCEAIEYADVTMDNAYQNDTNTGLHSFHLKDKLSCESEHTIISMDGDELCQTDDDFQYDFYSPLPERCTKGKQSGCTSHGKNLVLTRLRDWAAMARTKQQIDSKSSGCSINSCKANMAEVSHAIDSVPIVDTSQYHMFARKNTLSRRKI